MFTVASDPDSCLRSNDEPCLLRNDDNTDPAAPNYFFIFDPLLVFDAYI